MNERGGEEREVGRRGEEWTGGVGREWTGGEGRGEHSQYLTVTVETMKWWCLCMYVRNRLTTRMSVKQAVK